ncbi:MAG TPA: septal ring lytic transglycosylase RlpA family protein [Actinomycetota bacterium]|nr:septal ring lytic transglycosylase RlpA family protein [Actinomycetota bacterium]
MPRVRLDRVRSTTATLVALALLAVPGIASAQTASEPVITSAPGRVSYDGRGVIEGTMEGGTPGQELELQRRLGDGEWRRIASKPLDESGRVRFPLHDLHRSAGYRLVHTDPATAVTTSSDRHRIAVTPRLRLRTSKDHLMQGRRLRLSGSLLPAVPGRTVLLQQKVAGEWRYVDRLRAGDGRFSRYFRPDHDGFRRLRARFAGDGYNRRAVQREGIRVYEPDLATWYGPGFYGNTTACGKRLGYDTLGVAHRSLPCGTDVALLYQGRTITVPVIDRGPYSSADWDLTEETADRLGFSGKETIGTDH